MTQEKESSDSNLIIQEHCIDLPGETVQCWIGAGTDKLKVILRKHRDVVFDIHLENGKTYTIEATDSDFYNPRDKKLICALRREKVTFRDGERTHVWVSRGFRGSLIVKSDNHVISTVKPNEWDKHSHSDNPKEKPAPIIVAIACSQSDAKSTIPSKTTSPQISHSEGHSLHVHEVSKSGAPAAVLKFFEDGGETFNLDDENIITRNWIISQVAGAEGYLLDSRAWSKELMECKFYLQKVNHKSGVKVYMIFSGNNKIREVMTASKYGLQNAKIIKITGGAGGVSQTWDATKGAAKDSVKVFAKEEGKMVVKGGGVAVVLTIGMDVAEWYKDYAEVDSDGHPKKDFYDLFAKVGTDLVKAGLVAVLTSAIVSALFSGLMAVGLTAAAAAAAPVALVVVGTIAVGVALAYGVEWADRKIAHFVDEGDTTTWLAKKFRAIAQDLSRISRDARYLHYETIQILPISR